MADAETAPLPKITIEEPPPPPSPARSRSPISRLGDLPMRVIYRLVVGVTAAAIVAAVAAFFYVNDSGKGGQTAAGPVATRPLPTPAARSTAPETATASPSGVPATSAPADPAGSAAANPAVPGPSAAPGSSATAGAPSAPGSSAASGVSATTAQAGATPVPTPLPGKSALAAAEADPRVPAPPADRKLANFPGHGTPTKGRVKDKRSGISFTRFVKAWKLTRSSPFATRRVLPAAKGAGHRGLLATCPVPIAVQDDLKDTAYLAARWSLNHHPAGSTITWTASQGFKAGKREGWLLGYRVNYKAGGKKHVATAAVALIDVPDGKPAMVLITVPDVQKKRWADINTLVRSIRPL
ncbi:hypothetical protein [Sphaerisporangium dianthi]|uniref:Serine/threonine protein kinase n=1 Tax=Sphaerisporangium dianthi TaxID=1436120 RepID=A0ABV9CH00_9ACTN